MRPDKIIVYNTGSGPKSQRYRWTRKSGANGKKIAASNEGYGKKQSAVANIERTQKEPFVLIDETLK